MKDLTDRKVEVTEVIDTSGGVVTQRETVIQASEDERETSQITLNRFVAHWCGHYKPYGFSCSCGNRFCKDCFDAGRIWYCDECGVTIGPCCFRKRYDGKILCPEHSGAIDWQHPLFKILGGVGLLIALALSLYLLDRIVGG